MTTPPLVRTCLRMSSGTFLTWSVTPRAPECEKMTGAVDTLRASAMVCLGAGAVTSPPSLQYLDTWERSTIMPSLFISLTTRSPNWDSPAPPDSSSAASAQGVLQLYSVFST